ncbi:MAG: imidazolonepropionase-like amidohydrolase [Arenicella sp.]|jgi:imidazolonepropionase-like amidohydrolase
MRKLVLLLIFVGLSFGTFAQDNFPINGIRDRRAGAVAFTNATIFTNSNTKIENATLLIKEGKVVGVGKGLSIPEGYTEMNMEGKFIYPSFIDLHTSYGMPEVKSGGFNWGSAEVIEPETKGAYNANDAIKTHISASEVFTSDKKGAKEMRDLGFGTVLTFHPDGLARGTSALVSLGEESENNSILKSMVGSHYSFEKGTSKQDYPISDMGYVAVLRQTHFDADWYKSAKNKDFFDQTLEAYNSQRTLPQFFTVGDWQEILRADNMGDELGKQYIIKTGGDEYRRLSELKKTNAKLIVPLNFPKAMKVGDPLEALKISLDQMKHWELAPTNLAKLQEAGMSFALTTSDLKSKKAFWKNLRAAIKHGLSEEMALKALTETPAEMIGAGSMVGTLEKGKLANFIIVSDNIFNEKATIHHNWVQGNPFIIKAIDDSEYAGMYDLKVGSETYKLEISGEKGKSKFKIVVNDSTNISVKGSVSKGMISMSFKPNKEEVGSNRLTGWFNQAKEKKDYAFNGKAELVDGSMADWSAKFQTELEKKEDKKEDADKKDEADKEDAKPEVGEVIYPFVAYGSTEKAKSENFIIKNATVWTNEKDGVLQKTDVIVKDGKIYKVGKDLSANGLKEIDGTGKHVTTGIIDEHSHIALRSVNDVDVVSSQVRMSDVVDSDDINIYRQLAGGVTAAQLLHGSANPVGGQSALIKLRWGMSPQEMLIKNSDGYIKFALGENVKRSRSSNSIRYPQTRMGVEQIYADYFRRAKEYDMAWKNYKKKGGIAPRRDLQLEAMVEILNDKRFISCHSYVQSEISMLMALGDEIGFRVNTFTHILEGYKVADKMVKHGAGGSTFSDWWAYKYEVNDAIPYNATIMHKAGVVTAINSDDAEMGRRLNQEAAKSIKYGGVSEEEAWKMVTLNPAKLLHLDNRMGSMKTGKDADLVIWSDNPLSIYAIAEKTFVDGIAYYDAEKDEKLKEYIQKERARLIAKIQGDKAGGKTKPMGKPKRHFHCDHIQVAK